MTRDEKVRETICRLVDVAPVITAELGYSRRTCILHTRIATIVLRELGLRARPLGCRLLAGNAEWHELCNELGRLPTPDEWEHRDDVWCLGIGFGRGDQRGYDGHVVTVVEERYVVDLTVDQCDRPKYGMRFTPGFFPADRTFLSGAEPAVFVRDGSLLKYEALPKDRGFLMVPDWTEVAKTGTRVAAVNPLPLLRNAMRAAPAVR